MGQTPMQTLQQYVDESRRIVFFGGAGVSTESGIPDFRSEDGLYRQRYTYPPEEMLSRSFFDAHTEEFFGFYRDKVLALDAQPNPAHLKLAELEAKGRLLAVVTQNIDGLHQKGGSQNVIELHGSVHRNFCRRCGKAHAAAYVREAAGVPLCSCGGVVKPDVVLYEESLDADTLHRAVEALSQADLLIIGGTSLVVYPAAGLIDHYRGGKVVVINKDPGSGRRADLFIQTPIGQVLGALEIT